jgi:hypothetical protein
MPQRNRGTVPCSANSNDSATVLGRIRDGENTEGTPSVKTVGSIQTPEWSLTPGRSLTDRSRQSIEAQFMSWPPTAVRAATLSCRRQEKTSKLVRDLPVAISFGREKATARYRVRCRGSFGLVRNPGTGQLLF